MLIFIIIAIVLLIFLFYSFIPANINKKKFFCRRKTTKKIVYLTFDDGPSEYTEELLDLLKKFNIKATFFCVANFAKKYSKTIERMKKEGHTIALHSLKHKNSMLQGIFETKADLNKSLLIMNELGVEIHYYRPPWGDANLYLQRKLKNYHIKMILWDTMAEDWLANTTSDTISDKLLKRVKNGNIICLHDGRGKKEAPKRTIEALEKVLPIFLEKGYEFKTIDEYKD